MVTFIWHVIRATPLWVWAILATLIVIGLRQLNDRSIRPATIFIAPLVFMMIGLLSSGRKGEASVCWAIAVVVFATYTAMRWKPTAGARYDKQTARIHIPGSAMPLCFMLAIFLFNYVIQVMFAINASIAASLAWQVGVASILGASTGVLFGRAVSVYCLRIA
jgi:hypothetical protein